MGKLAVLPNIGVKLEEQLNVAGIETPEQLRAIGSHEAWLRLKRMNPAVSMTSLYAIEGAIRGIRWHMLDAQIRHSLRAFAASAEHILRRKGE